MIASINQNDDTNLTMLLSAALPPFLRDSLTHISCTETTTSTNNVLKTLAERAVLPAMCMALSQSHGRGQHERQWLSPKGNLYLSMLLPLTQPIAGRLAIEVALAILGIPLLQASEALYIKWPNDIGTVTLGQFSKCAGILIEPIDSHLAVIGVGMNVETLENHNLDITTTSLRQLLSRPPDLFTLAAQVATAIWEATAQFNSASMLLAQRFTPQHDALFGKKIEVQNPLTPEQCILGMGSGINKDGALLIQQENTLHAVYNGPVRLL